MYLSTDVLSLLYLNLLNFLDFKSNIFLCHLYLGTFQSLFLQVFFLLLSLSIPSETPIMHVLGCWVVFDRCLRLCWFFFTLFVSHVRSSQLTCLHFIVFKLTDSFFSQFKYAVQTNKVFHFSYYIFQCQNFYFILWKKIIFIFLLVIYLMRCCLHTFLNS